MYVSIKAGGVWDMYICMKAAISAAMCVCVCVCVCVWWGGRLRVPESEQGARLVSGCGGSVLGIYLLSSILSYNIYIYTYIHTYMYRCARSCARRAFVERLRWASLKYIHIHAYIHTHTHTHT